jgi:hypothetical protein
MKIKNLDDQGELIFLRQVIENVFEFASKKPNLCIVKVQV